MSAAAAPARPPLPAPGSVGAWKLAVRPPTLVAGFAPVLVGTAVAFDDGAGPSGLAVAAAALVVALGIQIGTNLVNDWADWRKGADTAERVGPPRVCQLGLLPPRTVLVAAAVAFAAAAVAGATIAFTTDPVPVFAIGALCLLCGVAYTAGPAPLAYLGLGEVFTFVFFGLVATAGTYAVVAFGDTAPGTSLGALATRPVPVSFGAALGALSAALLAVNNLRDIVTDVPAGKRTLATRLGRTGTKVEIVALVASAFVCCAVAVALGAPVWTLLSFAAVPFAVVALRPVLADDGSAPAALIGSLRGIARTELVLAVAVTVGYVLASVGGRVV